MKLFINCPNCSFPFAMASSQLISLMKPYSVITRLISLYLLIPLLPILMGNVMVAGQCREDQRSLLLQLKRGLKLNQSMDSKIRMFWWNASTDCCLEWPGISCDPGGLGRVVQLHLSDQGIVGGGRLDDSTTLFSLRYLEILDLSYNRFNTTIPIALANLTNLRYLSLSNAGFIGTFPNKIVQSLTQLESVDVSCNQLEGPIPRSDKAEGNDAASRP